MAALANLSKFLGCYDYWKVLLRNSGLRWEKRPSIEAVLSILSSNLDEALDRLKNVVKQVPTKYLSEALL